MHQVFRQMGPEAAAADEAMLPYPTATLHHPAPTYPTFQYSHTGLTYK